MGKRLVPTSATAVFSANRKLGRAAATYASIEATCPTSCVLRDNGCYGQHGLVGMETRQLNAGARGLSALQVAGVEAAKIDALPVSGRPLRLHVVGDCSTDAAARIVSGAADRYSKRTGQPAWTYTHAWRDVDRASWGQVNVLASCETPAETVEAMARGYAAALVVEEHPGVRAYELDMITVIPCPQESGNGITCADCKLCTRTEFLRGADKVIGFAVHSAGLKKARAAIRRKN